MKAYTFKLYREKQRLEKLVALRTQELKEASLTDPLTGLRNRRYVMEILQSDITAFVDFRKHILQASNRREDPSKDKVVFGIFLLDIDFFKSVNDKYGHDAGDQLLKQFAALLRSSVRADDTVTRVGGEEFVIMLKKTNPEYLPVYAAKILSRVAAASFELSKGLIIKKTCSIGYLSFPFFPEQPALLNLDQSIMIADLGLYYAKNHGRNQAAFHIPGGKFPDTEEQIRNMLTSADYAIEQGFMRLGQPPRQSS